MIGAQIRENQPGSFSLARTKRPNLYQANDIKDAANAFLEKRSILPYGEHTRFSQFKTK